MFVPALIRSLVLPIAVCAAAPCTAPDVEGHVPPEVGEPAPPLGDVQWLQLPGGADPGKLPGPSLAALRGKVVVVTTYGYYCDSCVRIGIPLANALRASNPNAELALVSLTAGIGDDGPELVVKKARELGIEQAVGLGGALGDSSPYLNLNVSPNLTFAFVIHRNGLIAWKGDPSRERGEYLATVARALHAAPSEAPPTVSKELLPASRAYANDEFELAEREARRVETKLAKKPGAAAQQSVAEARGLIGCVGKTRTALQTELKAAAEAKDAERFVRARDRALRAFPKSPLAAEAEALAKTALADAAFAAACEPWTAWVFLERSRPPNWPAENDKCAAKFAKEAVRYAEKHPQGPGTEKVRAWLEAAAKKER